MPICLDNHFTTGAGARLVETGSACYSRQTACLAVCEIVTAAEHANNRSAYEKLMRTAGVPEIRQLIDRIRETTAQQILAGLVPNAPPPPRVRAAVRGWLWYMDGVCLDWVREEDMARADVHELLLGSLFGALSAAGFEAHD